ncbi:PQ loop repeat-domain-containing protein [Gaertneriomyces semiglobifer]|nr:PQ loop repeat-domain-containing protein [Gaertneriomyces semiglobifer]
MDFWVAISWLLGWGSFAAWSLSFYPQVILNWQRKSVHGLSLDFVFLNSWGFLCYSIFNVLLYIAPERWGFEGSIELNDVVFSVHGFLMTVIVVGQTYWYSGTAAAPHASTWARAIIAITATGAGIAVFLASQKVITGLSALYYISYIKIALTLIKYAPQAFYNFHRKSTDGWSIHNIVLDLTGGIFSLLQTMIVVGNIIKSGLGLVTVAFDLVFIMQHLRYRPPSHSDYSEIIEEGDFEREYRI